MAAADHLKQQRAFAAHIRSPAQVSPPEGTNARRMKVYSDLFFNNVKGFLDGTFPVCAEIIGDVRWSAIARDFFASHFCKTPYFLEIPREFLAYLESGFKPDSNDPLYLYELAHYEWLELAVDVSPDEVDVEFDANADLTASVPVFAAAAEAFIYQYPVHQISVSNAAPQPQQTPLIVFRDRQEQVRFIETNLMTVQLMMLLRSQELTGIAAVEQLLRENQLALTDVATRGGLAILEQWHQQGLVLGGRVE